ncbi:MAG: hypothetical protein Q8L14_15360 [Myxococcales bacterium]|nr:hypothetical protein [Myxococcales bacterium]
MRLQLRALAVTVLMGGCQCFVPVTEDSGVQLDGGAAIVDAGADAGVIDAGIDAGLFDAGGDVDGGAGGGLVDAGNPDAGTPDGGGQPSCATVRCSPWTTCFEDAGAVCVPTVIALRWVVPASDAAVPIDTIRLAVAIDVMGVVEASIPVTASGAGQSTTVATRSDAGLAFGSLSFTTLDAGRLLLSAGWDGGPQTTTVLNVLPTRAIEIVGANPPSHGVNTADFEPNDPEGDAWRRDDVVPFRGWPGGLVIARHDHPDASAAIIDAGESCDGGCSSFRLQDVEFNAFRGDVELRVVSDAGWEARGERLTVTRWRWRRVVAGVPNPVKVQTPVMTRCSYSSSEACVVVGTEDTLATGRLVALSEDGVPMTSTWLPQRWTAAVTAPVDGCQKILAGFDGDAGFLWSGQSSRFGADLLGERYVLLGGTDATTVAVTDQAGVVGVPDFTDIFSEFRPAWPSGRCRFDAGVPAYLGTARYFAAISSSSGELCLAPQFLPYDAGITTIARDRVFPFAIAGELPWGVTSDGYFSRLAPPAPIFDAGVVDTIVQAGSDWFYFTPAPSLVRVRLLGPAPTPTGIQASSVATAAVRARVTSPPIYRALRREQAGWFEGMIHAVGGDQRLMAISTDTMSERWGWAPDGGINLSAPMGFAPSLSRNGSILLPTRGAVVSVVADGVSLQLYAGWTQAGGDAANCGGVGDFVTFP